MRIPDADIEMMNPILKLAKSTCRIVVAGRGVLQSLVHAQCNLEEEFGEMWLLDLAYNLTHSRPGTWW